MKSLNQSLINLNDQQRSQNKKLNKQIDSLSINLIESKQIQSKKYVKESQHRSPPIT